MTHAPRLAVTAAVLVVTLLAAACTGPGGGDGPPPAERIAAINATRDAYGDAAGDLGEAAVLLDEGLLRARLAASSSDRASWLSWTGEALTGLDAALSTIEVIRAAADDEAVAVADTVAAESALVEAIDAARSAMASARRHHGQLTLVLDSDATLTSLVATWDEPGSRSQQLERLSATEAAARELAAGLTAELASGRAAADGGGDCDLVARRISAAGTVAANSAELRQHVANRRGTAFDSARTAFRADPFGLGVPDLAELDVRDAACLPANWPGGGAAVVAALGAFADALNPADLRPGGPTTP